VAADAEVGAALHMACWREAYTPYADPALLAERLASTGRFVEAWTKHLASGPPRVLAEADGELYAIYTRAAWWGTGLGQQLWDAVRPEEPCSLWVLEDNQRARGFYRRNGFVPDGARELYEDLGAWEIRMVRP
jgi:GNAT superfamily N-acetyltransferase